MSVTNVSVEAMRLARPGDTITRGAVVFVVTEVVDGHVWGRVSGGLPGECCRICGAMRRADKQNRACPGPVVITTR